jgi:cytochrome c peroxidase
MKKTFLLLLSIVVAGIYSSCKKEELKDPSFTYNPSPYELQIPAFFPKPEIPATNPLTREGVELGRKLYYEPLLSKGGPNNGLSCSSCHLQNYGFMIPNKPFEEFGVVMPHINLAWSKNFLWNGKVSGTLEDIMRFEVNDFFQANMELFKTHQDYPRLFHEAFGPGEITSDRASMALAQFFRVMVSGDSKLDKFLRKEGGLNPQEMQGFNIFNSEKGDCFHCHSLGLFTDDDFHNIGLDDVFTGFGMGRYNVTGRAADLGKFKTPTLRNVALRKIYMHDGRFKSLEEVVEHYNSGVKYSPQLDPLMTKPGKEYGLNLSPEEKEALVAFLKTLTDERFIANQALARP